MMKWIIFFFTFSVLASSALKENLQGILPSPIKNFNIKSTSLSEVEKSLGKAHLVEGSKHYWERDGLKYALELSFDNKLILKSIHFTFTGKRPSLKEAGNINTKKLTPYPEKGKASGRFLVLKESDSELVIDPLSKTIHTVKIQ